MKSQLERFKVDELAKRLLGAHLVRTIDNDQIRTRIVEVEAYDEADPASHSYKGLTSRNKDMFGPAGIAYVYLIYGMYNCLNVTAGQEGAGEAVLIRAVEPIEGIELLQKRRPKVTKEQNLCNGPGKLTQALGIDRSFCSHNLKNQPLQLELLTPLCDKDISQTTRIGISQGKALERRYYIADSQFVSNKESTKKR